MIDFTIPLPPTAKGRPRFGRNGAYTPTKTRVFESAFRLLSRKHAPREMLEGPLKMEVFFTVKIPKKRPKFPFPITKPDGDNFLKAIFDSMEGVFFKNDSQICDGRFVKLYDVTNSGARIRVLLCKVSESAITNLEEKYK